MEKSPVTRFAPSPTGLLHLGHAFAAYVAYAAATEGNGTFILRHEDIDSSRVRPDFYSAIEKDLQWLGFPWDGTPLRQLDRAPAYQEAFDRLNQLRLLYPCFCTRKQIQAELKELQGAPHRTTGVYPGTCRKLSEVERGELQASGIAYSWRFDSKKAAAMHGQLTFTDKRFGEIKVDPSINGDVVISRKDIGIAYHLAVVVDDEFQKITHVTRGDDLLESTHIHRQLQAILQFKEPSYHHHASVVDKIGKRLSKRDESLTIASLREDGMAPEEVIELAKKSLA